DPEHALVGMGGGRAPRSDLPEEVDLEGLMRGPALTADPQAGNGQAPGGRLALAGTVALVDRIEVHLGRKRRAVPRKLPPCTEQRCIRARIVTPSTIRKQRVAVIGKCRHG